MMIQSIDVEWGIIVDIELVVMLLRHSFIGMDKLCQFPPFMKCILLSQLQQPSRERRREVIHPKYVPREIANDDNVLWWIVREGFPDAIGMLDAGRVHFGPL